MIVYFGTSSEFFEQKEKTLTTSVSHDPRKFVHVADLHLAPRSSTITKKDPATNRLVRDLDMERAFEDSVTEALSQDPLPSAYVIAGDIFDTYRGSSDAFICVVKQIRRLRAAGIQVLAIAGNHDTPTNVMKTPMYKMLKNVFEEPQPVNIRKDSGVISELLTVLSESGQDSDEILGLVSKLNAEYGIKPSSEDLVSELSEGKDEGVVLAYDKIEHVVVGDVEYVLLPHLSCLAGGFTEDELSATSDALFRVLVVHGVAAGDPSLQQMDEMKEIPIAKWILDMDWSYVAFGHYHKPGWIPGYVGKAAYSGSLENTVISGPDVSMARGPVFVDFSKTGEDLYDMHLRAPRAIVELPDIDLAGAEYNAEELEHQIEEVILDADVDGAIVRHTVKNVPRSLYKTMTHRNFQHVNPKMLFIKTNYEFAVEATQKRTMIKSDDEDVEIESDALEKGAEDAFHPLAKEIDSALDALIADGTIREGQREAVRDVIAALM